MQACRVQSVNHRFVGPGGKTQQNICQRIAKHKVTMLMRKCIYDTFTHLATYTSLGNLNCRTPSLIFAILSLRQADERGLPKIDSETLVDDNTWI